MTVVEEIQRSLDTLAQDSSCLLDSEALRTTKDLLQVGTTARNKAQTVANTSSLCQCKPRDFVQALLILGRKSSSTM